MSVRYRPSQGHKHEPWPGVFVADNGMTWRTVDRCEVAPGMYVTSHPEMNPDVLGAIAQCECGQNFIVERPTRVNVGQQYCGLLAMPISRRRADRAIRRTAKRAD